MPSNDIDDDEAGQERRNERARKGVARDAAPTRTLVVVPWRTERPARGEGGEIAPRSLDARVEEAVGLARAIELDVVASPAVRIAEPKPATLLGQGKVDELKKAIEDEKIELVVVDHPLSPIQQRNLEKTWGAKVLDRTGLILEIFGERAHTKEGRLQVELAHLTYQKSRLVRSWTHLERQRGGFGFLGGPGETQIEADRRQIQERIARLERDLESVARTRALHRKNRKKVPHPIVALVGYTNAGKSTLFNRLTEADVFAKDLLFATLDPTLRKVRLPHGGDVILSDTVGFVSDLPTTLVAAFRATLEEVIEADLILHVRDIAHEDTGPQARDVENVLSQLGVDPKDRDRVIEVWNKIDKLAPEHRADLLAEGARPALDEPTAIPCSAMTGDGVAALLDLIEDRLNRDRAVFRVEVPVEEGELVAWLHRNTEVVERRDGEETVSLRLRVPEKALDHFRARAGRFIREVRGRVVERASAEEPREASGPYDPLG
ncbi:GTPase HflX [Pinisolibacter sp.]|uniref:GTPase HflX n=1 Tax=Pinisolibacter sp. TaxID=2172024 RepID=UPI002FDD2D9D